MAWSRVIGLVFQSGTPDEIANGRRRLECQGVGPPGLERDQPVMSRPLSNQLSYELSDE